jgi:hypothetical protein
MAIVLVNFRKNFREKISGNFSNRWVFILADFYFFCKNKPIGGMGGCS